MYIPPRFTIVDDDPALVGRFTVWMEWVVSHAATDYSRRQDSHKQELYGLQPTDEIGYEDLPPPSDGRFVFENDKLEETFSKLTSLRRKILTLIFVEGLSAQETADKLGCSVDYVYLQKHRTLKKLRDYLMDGGDKRGK